MIKSPQSVLEEESIYTSKLKDAADTAIGNASATVKPSSTAQKSKEHAKHEMPMRPINPQEEYSYWESIYVASDRNSEDKFDAGYGPAYRYGVEAFHHFGGRKLEDIDEQDLRRGWEKYPHRSSLDWKDAAQPVKSAYMRLQNA